MYNIQHYCVWVYLYGHIHCRISWESDFCNFSNLRGKCQNQNIHQILSVLEFTCANNIINIIKLIINNIEDCQIFDVMRKKRINLKSIKS